MLDHVPVATLSFLAGVGLALLGYLNHDLSIFQAFEAAGIVGVGSGAIGHARNGAGRGVKR